MQSLSHDVTLYERALASVPASFPTSLDIMSSDPGLAGILSRIRMPQRRSRSPLGRAGGVFGAGARFAKARKRRRRGSLRRAQPSVTRSMRSFVARSGLRGLGDFWDSVGDIFGKVGTVKNELEAKAEKLELAIKAILVLSGVAAVTGTVNMLRR